jgi:hypothetical protein
VTNKQTYVDLLVADFNNLIAAMDVDDVYKHFLRSRWLDQVTWLEGKADGARRWYYTLRLTAIIGGVIIPALVSLNIGGQAAIWTRWSVFVLSLLVAISTAMEEFFHYGDRWRHYRQTVETLKSEGWQFFQLAGNYRRFQKHTQAYPRFATRVEEIGQHDVQLYITEVVDEKKESGDGAED